MSSSCYQPTSTSSPPVNNMDQQLTEALHHNAAASSSGNNKLVADLSGFDLLSDQPPPLGSGDDLVGSLLRDDILFGGSGGVGGGMGLDLTSGTHITNSQSLSNNLSALLTGDSSGQQVAPQQKPLSFDYLYEFSETRKVLEEFFTCQTSNDKILEKLSDFNESDNGGMMGGYDHVNSNMSSAQQPDDMLITNHHTTTNSTNASYIGHRLANKFQPTATLPPADDYMSNSRRQHDDIYEHQDIELFLDSGSRSSGELADNEVDGHNVDGHTRNFTLSPETTDYDSNCGDLDSEVSLRYTGLGGEFGK